MEDDQKHKNPPNVAATTSCQDTDNNYTNDANREHDRFLPIANVGRIMKKKIPNNGKISKDAKETVQECVSEFISFVTGEASDKCQREKRKTINGDDIIWAITTLGFENYVSPLKQYLMKYREVEGEKLHLPKQQQPQRSEQQQQQQQQHQNMSYGNDCAQYSSTSLVSQPSFMPSDQQFPFPFPPSSYQNQLQQQNQMDSLGPW